MLNLDKNKVLLLLIHVFIGFVLVYTPKVFNKILSVLFFLIGIYTIYQSKNSNERALLVTFYLMSAEVFLRMTKSTISWDFGKYATMAFLITGMLTEKKERPFPFQFIIYLLLISVGIAFTNIPIGGSYRKVILFNISGPLCLGISAIYFYKRQIDFKILKQCFYLGILPVVSMVVYIYFRAPSIKEIVFNSAANAAASGGFGPNQVSTSIGLGLFLLGVLLLLNKRFSGNLILDCFIFFYMIYRGLLTFSRGGMLTGFGTLLIIVVFYLIQKGNFKELFKYVTVFSLVMFAVWSISANLTGGMLNNRYLGKSSTGEQKEDITSGRTDIIEDQLNNFYEHPLIGLGVGSGDVKRKVEFDGDIMNTSHNEIGRLLEDHGLVGLLSLILLIVSFSQNYFSTPGLLYKGFILSFFVLWFLTINHSGMRIAFPGFIYGLSLIRIKEDRYEEE